MVVMVVIVVPAAPGGGSIAGTPRPTPTPNPVEPENPRLSFSRSLTPLRLSPPASQQPLSPHILSLPSVSFIAVSATLNEHDRL